MGTKIEFNDTLKLSKGGGFPSDLNLNDYVKDSLRIREKFLGQTFDFEKSDVRIFHTGADTRVFLVEDINGMWLYWGHAVIEKLSTDGEVTSGRYRITKLYDIDYQRLATINESPDGRSYFGDHL